jgi:hypothetical protein
MIRALVAAFWSAIALVVVPQLAQAEFKKVEERPVGRWTLTAIVETGTDYAMCLVTSLNDLGEHLNIVVERPKHLWSLAFAGRDVRLRDGVASDFEVTYAIDDNEPRRVQAIPSATGRVFVQLGQDVALMEPVRRGGRIAFETADGTHAFSLAGSSAALDALSDCAMRHLGFTEIKTPSDPASAASTSAPASAEPFPQSTIAPQEPETAAHASKTLEERDLPNWALDAFEDTSSGKAVCMIRTLNEQTAILTILAESSPHVWTLLINGKSLDWHLDQVAEYELSYSIDGRAPVVVKVRALTETEIFLDLGKTFAVTDPFRHGSSVDFRMDQGTTSFRLTGSVRALDALLECANRHLGFHESKD